MRSQLHPEVQEVMEIFDALNVSEHYKLGPVKCRELFTSLRADPETYPPIHAVSNLTIAGPGGDLPVRIFRPSNEQGLGALVWFHGGGWVFGTLDSTEIPARDIANVSNSVVISVDYRLAPETRFPGAFDDCLAATNWVFENATALGIDSGRIAVGGDSAGGNLAAAVALASKQGQGPPLAHQLLVYPVVDPAMSQASYAANGEGFFLTIPAMKWFWDCYVPDESQRNDPRVAPALANLAGVCSAWVFTAGFDPLRDEGREFADKLEAAGVVTERFEQADVIHGIFTIAIARGAEARRAAGQSLARAFSR